MPKPSSWTTNAQLSPCQWTESDDRQARFAQRLVSSAERLQPGKSMARTPEHGIPLSDPLTAPRPSAHQGPMRLRCIPRKPERETADEVSFTLAGPELRRPRDQRTGVGRRGTGANASALACGSIAGLDRDMVRPSPNTELSVCSSHTHTPPSEGRRIACESSRLTLHALPAERSI
jgi:hypothetical protein